jgi:hypothetical protein
MSGQDSGSIQQSELSVSVVRPAAGDGGEEDAPPSPTRVLARRVPGATTPPEGPLWTPAATAGDGGETTLTGALLRVLSGLGA